MACLIAKRARLHIKAFGSSAVLRTRTPCSARLSPVAGLYPRGLGHLCHKMHYRKGEDDQDSCHDDSICGCHESPMGVTDLSPCHDPGSLSRDVEGSCQSVPQACQLPEPCPPQNCCPPQQRCSFGKPRRRVELSPVQPCRPPVKIHRRPLQQYRPPLQSEEPGSCGKPRRRVEQCPVQEPCLPVPLRPRPLQSRCPSVPCCCPPIQRCCPPTQHCRPPIQHCCPPAVQHPGQHQHKQVPLLPPCLQKK
ncbi:uncharacterized protein [Anser cygnoides]|uniref:uncharacterized protein n=1 Tax=Anser cygnoides TaxID=8845 RepID=UPI0034D2F0AD